jgi:hypothetical protein
MFRPLSCSSRRRAVFGALAIGSAVALGGCASLGPRHVTLSEADLQRLLERQFPREQRVMEVFDLRIARPTLRLLPERSRIATEVEVTAGERLTGRTLRGSVALDYGLRYEPSDASLRLTQVRVQDLKLDVGGTALQGQAARMGGMLAERALDDIVIYRVDEARRDQLRRAGVAGADIVITARGVELRFTEAR